MSAPTDVKINIDGTSSTIDVLCLACDSGKCDFRVQRMQRRAMRPDDVVIDMKYCGVCHSDLHQAAGHMEGVMGRVQYPMVPGHELSGIVRAIGSAVTKFKVGDQIGVGCMVDACMDCTQCKAGEEQKCVKGQVGTYCGNDKYGGRAAQVPVGRQTLGGYTDVFVVNEKFGIKIPEGYPLEAAGPVMCAGVTMYDPLVVNNAQNGTRVGIVGLGGLGQMGVKIAKARGCKVTVISRTAAKSAFATTTCGADDFIVSENPEDMARAAGSLDLILNTVPVYHDYNAYRKLLKAKGGKQVLLGLHTGFIGALLAGVIVGNRSSLSGSGIGGIRATQEVMDLCATRGIKPDIEVVPVTQIHRVYESLDANNDSGVRYVLDIANTLKAPNETAAQGRLPKLAPPNKKIGILRILGEVLKILVCGRYK